MSPRAAIRIVSFLSVILGSAVSVPAAQLKEAQVTQVVKDVKLLPTGAVARPAAVSDEVREGTAVRTGVDSRSELKFTDQTLARLGANTIFSFAEGTRNLNLQDGAMLLRVPKGAGGAKINSSAVTAAITGTTVMVETHAVTKKNKNSYYKFIVLEGTARLYLPGRLGESTLVKAGQMIIMRLDSKMIPEPVDVDISKITQSSLLVTGFPTPLGSENLIAYEQLKQNNQKASGQLYETNLVIYGGGTNVVLADPNTVDVAISAESNAAQSPTPTPTVTPTPAPPPDKFGTPSTIASPNPYVINSGTVITTDPSITTNGVTDSGKIYRGPVTDGPASAWAFGSTSTFDTASGFDSQINTSGAAFKFTALQLAGNPTISTANGEINLGLIAVNGITSGSPGGPLTFSGIRGLLLATQNGPIDLGSEISFSGLHDLTVYARGVGSDLTLSSAISGLTQTTLIAQGDVNIDGTTLGSQMLRVVAGTNINVGVNAPVTITGNEATLLIPNSGTGNIAGDATITLTPAGNLALNGANGLSLTVDNSDGGHIGQSATILLSSPNLTAGSLNMFINNRNGGSIGSSAQVLCNLTGALTTQGDVNIGSSNRNDGLGGGTMATDALVNIQANSISVGGVFDGFVSANAGGRVGGLALIRLNVAGDVHSGGGTLLENQATGFNVVGGPFIAPGLIVGDALINVSAANLTSDAFISSDISDQSGGINGNAGITFNVTGTIAAPEVDFFVGGPAGHIGGNALVFVNAGTLSAPTTGFQFQVGNGNGASIGGSAAMDVTATSLSGDSLFAGITSANGGTIGSTAGVIFNVSGTSTFAHDATFEITGSDGAQAAAIDINGGTYNVGVGVGGTFNGFIDGNGGFSLNNATIAADIVKIGVFGANGSLRIGGGSISANTLLHLYAPGSNGIVDFVSNVTLRNAGGAVVIAGNTVTVETGFIVTIAGSTPANVYANIPNYTGSGGNGSTRGVFGGAGATTQPLSQAPLFDNPPAVRAAMNHRNSVISSGGKGPAIEVTDSSQLGSLLNNATLGPDGKVRISPQGRSRNPSVQASTRMMAAKTELHRSVDARARSGVLASRFQ
jgi:FecR protein